MMAFILDDICEDGPVLSEEMARPKGVSKAAVQRCVAAFLWHWTPEQYDAVVEMFQTHGLL